MFSQRPVQIMFLSWKGMWNNLISFLLVFGLAKSNLHNICANKEYLQNFRVQGMRTYFWIEPVTDIW